MHPLLRCTWGIKYHVLILMFAIYIFQLMMFVPLFTCSTTVALPLCMPQFQLRLQQNSTIAQNFLYSAKELLKLLSFLAIDLGWDVDSSALPGSEDYDESNIVNTFQPTNLYRINFFGYCKKQSGPQKLKNYCVDNWNGVDLFAIFIRDMGFQFGKLSSSNVKIMSDSFMLAYELGVRSLYELFYQSTGSKGVKSSLLDTLNSTASEDSPQFEGIYNYVQIAMILKRLSKFINIMILLECGCCCLGVLTFGYIGTHVWLLQKYFKECSTSKCITSMKNINLSILIIRVLAVLAPLGGVIVNLMTLVYLIALKNLSYYAGQEEKMFEVGIGTGFYFNLAKFFLQLSILICCFKVIQPFSAFEITSVSCGDERRVKMTPLEGPTPVESTLTLTPFAKLTEISDTEMVSLENDTPSLVIHNELNTKRSVSDTNSEEKSDQNLKFTA